MAVIEPSRPLNKAGRPFAAPVPPAIVPTRPALARGPRHRACRAILEAADLAHEAQALAAPLLQRTRKRRNKADALALEALLTAIRDQLDELNSAGMALCQLATIWSDDAGCGR
jgi:hypothetical protein